jgi:hypothetical protein
MQELTTMNVQMRLITEDNINKMVNMHESPTLQRLSGHTLHEWLAQSKDAVMLAQPTYENDIKSPDRDISDRDSPADNDWNKGSPIYNAEGLSAADGSAAAEDMQGPQTPTYNTYVEPLTGGPPNENNLPPPIAGAPAKNNIFALDEPPPDSVVDAQPLETGTVKEVTI